MLKIFSKRDKILNTDIDTYMVSWYSTKVDYRESSFADIKPHYQAFSDKEEAEEFANSIRRAHKLIGNRGYSAEVCVNKMKNGL